MERSEQEMRNEQFIKALALASAAFKAGNYKDTDYWLNGAGLILSAAKADVQWGIKAL